MLEKVGIGRAAGVRVCAVLLYPVPRALCRTTIFSCTTAWCCKGLPEGPGVTQPAAGWGLKTNSAPPHSPLTSQNQRQIITIDSWIGRSQVFLKCATKLL